MKRQDSPRQTRAGAWRHVLAILAFTIAGVAQAHHGWRWTDDGDFSLTGTVRIAQLGNPHGVLTMDVNGETWIAEVGQPWRNERAGLTEAMLVKGVELTIVGKRAADAGDRKVKAERVVIKGRNYDLYPERLPDR